MAASPVSISDLATPAEWARHHGLSTTTAYRLIQAGRLEVLNISPGRRATYRLPLGQLPEQPVSRSWDASAETSTAAESAP